MRPSAIFTALALIGTCVSSAQTTPKTPAPNAVHDPVLSAKLTKAPAKGAKRLTKSPGKLKKGTRAMSSKMRAKRKPKA